MAYIGSKEYHVDSITITYEHVNSSCNAATSGTINLFPMWKDCYPDSLKARVKTAFTGTVTAPTVKVGDGTIADVYMANQPIDQIGDLVSGFAANAGGSCEKMGLPGRKTFTSNAVMKATFTSTSGNFGSLTAGEIEFVFSYAK